MEWSFHSNMLIVVYPGWGPKLQFMWPAFSQQKICSCIHLRCRQHVHFKLDPPNMIIRFQAQHQLNNEREYEIWNNLFSRNQFKSNIPPNQNAPTIQHKHIQISKVTFNMDGAPQMLAKFEWTDLLILFSREVTVSQFTTPHHVALTVALGKYQEYFSESIQGTVVWICQYNSLVLFILTGQKENLKRKKKLSRCMFQRWHQEICPSHWPFIQTQIQNSNLGSNIIVQLITH